MILEGKIIEYRQVKQTQSTKVGADYPDNIYYVIVVQGKKIKVLRLIKK